MLLQSRCAGCDRPGAVLCRSCRFALAAPSVRPSSSHTGGVVVALPFTGRVRDVLLGFKYRNRRQLATHLAALLVRRLVGAGVRPGHDVDVVTWAPTSASRRRQRGFDQAELVARHVARQLGVPCRRLLEREGPHVAQTGLDRAHRVHGPAFRARPDAPGRHVLLVDDVVTTGSTLRAAADALTRAGAERVVRCAVAATPPGRRQGATVIAGPWNATATARQRSA